jgi:hypothetical protein
LKELYNLRHAQLRKPVEKVIGRMKRLFVIFRKWPEYPIGQYSDVIVAAASVMNFVLDARDESLVQWDLLEDGFGGDVAHIPAREFYSAADAETGKKARMNIFRDEIAAEMWTSYQRVLEERRVS